MRGLDLSATSRQRSEDLNRFFLKNRVPHPTPDEHRFILPVTAFEEYAGISVADHPLFFRPEIFAGGTDFNICGTFHYMTIDGFYKAITVLAVANLIRKENSYGKDQST